MWIHRIHRSFLTPTATFRSITNLSKHRTCFSTQSPSSSPPPPPFSSSISSCYSSSLRSYFHFISLPPTRGTRQNPSLFSLSSLTTAMPTSDEVKQKILGGEDVQRLNKIFTSNGYDFRLVGGAVRDIFLGRWPKDLDFSTTALPEVTKDLLEKEGIRVVLTGLQHGTVTAVLNKEQYEITTLRLDHSINGVELDEPSYTCDWELDALRRDLTINALSLDFDGNLYDYFNGIEHLQQHKIMFVKNAVLRIQEDYLRILRYFRFHGSVCDRDTFEDSEIEAIKQNVSGLEGVSGERIWMEMGKILLSCRGPSLVQLMFECGVFPHIHLPDVRESHLQILEDVHRHDCNATTLLVCLLGDADQFQELFSHWHFSSAERKQALNIIQHRENPISMVVVEDLLVDKVERETVVQLCKYKQRDDLATHAASFPIPTFPITGKALIASGVKPGKAMGVIMGDLKAKWVNSRFKLSFEELMAQMPPTE
eukprot:m.38544 g.38544  ORF g.38544 m.38544 type:complete len:481 (+) comp10221_c0_seq2:62-1504(+)